MTCTHLKQLYELCGKHGLQISSSDLIRITCPQCGQQETCPSGQLDDVFTIDQLKRPQDSAADTQTADGD